MSTIDQVAEAFPDSPEVTLCRDMFIPRGGQPTVNGGTPFPFYVAEGDIDITVRAGGISEVCLTLIVQGVQVEG